MTGYDIIKKAMELLGYTASNGNLQLNARISSKSLAVVNVIYSDLWHVCYGGETDCFASARNDIKEFVPLENIHEEINLPERAINDVMIYGVASFIAQSESDGDQQQIYTTLYNQKRASLSKKETVQDVLPNCWD